MDIGTVQVSMTSSITSVNAVLAETSKHVDMLETPRVAEHIQTATQTVQVVKNAPFVAAVTTSDPWKLLRKRLDTLVEVGDSIAKVCLLCALPAPLQSQLITSDPSLH